MKKILRAQCQSLDHSLWREDPVDWLDQNFAISKFNPQLPWCEHIFHVSIWHYNCTEPFSYPNFWTTLISRRSTLVSAVGSMTLVTASTQSGDRMLEYWDTTCEQKQKKKKFSVTQICALLSYWQSLNVSIDWVKYWLKHRADSRLVPSQWETSLQNNAVSHWLGTNLESAL